MIQQLKNSGLFQRQLFQIDVNLESPTDIAEIKELAFAHIAMGRDSTRYTDPLAFRKAFRTSPQCRRHQIDLRTGPPSAQAVAAASDGGTQEDRFLPWKAESGVRSCRRSGAYGMQEHRNR